MGKKMKYSKILTILMAALAITTGCAGETGDELSAELDGELTIAGGKADGGDDIVVDAIRGGALVTLYGEPASISGTSSKTAASPSPLSAASSTSARATSLA